jgi:hypothetical protein
LGPHGKLQFGTTEELFSAREIVAVLQELWGAFEASREDAHRADDEFRDLHLRSIGEHGRQLNSLYSEVADGLGDRGRMDVLWEREHGLGGAKHATESGVAPSELHWDAQKELNAMVRWSGQAAKSDAASLREEACLHVAQHQADKDLRRRQVLSKYRV